MIYYETSNIDSFSMHFLWFCKCAVYDWGRDTIWDKSIYRIPEKTNDAIGMEIRIKQLYKNKFGISGGGSYFLFTKADVSNYYFDLNYNILKAKDIRLLILAGIAYKNVKHNNRYGNLDAPYAISVGHQSLYNFKNLEFYTEFRYNTSFDYLISEGVLLPFRKK